MKRWGIILLVLLAAVSFWLSGVQQQQLLRERQRYHLDQAEPDRNMPPLVAFTTVALGGFRGLLVDALWVRASQLQSDGKFFELVQLADWVTKLEPRSAAIWAFHAWNLSYNISVMMSSPEDRWRWVRHGIGLLRDEGLRYNPGSAQLYAELGWMFQHKMGGETDQAHWTYKREWAEEMTAALGGGTPDYEALLAAPGSLDVLRRGPAGPAVDALRHRGVDLATATALDDLLADSSLLDGVAAVDADLLLAFLRVRRLREVYKMDIERMRRVDAAYGPLDWRMPFTHAIYWSLDGIPYAANDSFRHQALRRMVSQSLVLSFQQGRLVAFTPGEGPLYATVHLELLPRVQQSYLLAMAEHPDNDSYRNAYHGFLDDAMLISHALGRLDLARLLFQELMLYGRRFEPGLTFAQVMDDAYREAWSDGRRHTTLAIIEGRLARAIALERRGDAQQAASLRAEAQRWWDHFMAARDDPEFRSRTALPSLEVIEEVLRQRQTDTADTPP